MLGHVQLHKLHAISVVEVLVGQELLKLVLGLDLVALGSLLRGAENGWEVSPLPLDDVVVLCLLAMDLALDGETFVADAEAGICQSL
jgi:hypothetical protein